MTIYLDETDEDGAELAPVPGHPWRVMHQSLSEGHEDVLQGRQLRRRMVQSIEHLTGVSAMRLEESACALSGFVRYEPVHPEDVANWRRLGTIEVDIFSDLEPQKDPVGERGFRGSTFAVSVLNLRAITDISGGKPTMMSTRTNIVLAFGAKSGAHFALRVHAMATGGEDAHLTVMEHTDRVRIMIERVLGEITGDSDDAVTGFEDFTGRIPEIQELAQIAAIGSQAALTFGSLRQEIQGLRTSLAMAHRQIQEQEDDLEQLRHQVSAMRPGRIERFDQEAKEEPAQQPPDKDLDWLPQWAQSNAHRITITPRALAGAKKSLYEHPEHVRPALEFLAGPYRQARLGEIDRDTMESALRASGCQMRGSAGAQAAHTAGDAYFVRWGSRNRLRLMDMHLTRGGGHDQRYCMRIYWFWDSESKQVIVGHLPQHLPNSLS